MVKNLPEMWETWVQSLGWEDTLQKGIATHSSILAWRISWTEEPGELQSMGFQGVGHDWATNTFTFNIHTYIHTYLIHICTYMCVLSPSAVFDSMQPHGPPGSSVHGISQARILEWVAISFSRGSFWPRDPTCISCISCAGRRIFFTTSTSWDVHIHTYMYYSITVLHTGNQHNIVNQLIFNFKKYRIMPLGQSQETAARIQWDDQCQDWAQGLVLRKPS